MMSKNRMHRELRIEELETRATPVSLSALPIGGETIVTQIGDMSLHYDFGAPDLSDIEGDSGTLMIDGTDLVADEGSPVLPARTINFLLPQGMDLTGIDIAFSNPISLGTWQPEIGGPATQTGTEGETAAADPMLSPDWTPRLYDVGQVQRLSGHAIASVTLYPIQFDPVTSEAMFYSSMTVTANTVDTTPRGDGWVSCVRDNDIDRMHLAALVDNPSVMSTYDTTSTPAQTHLGAQALSEGQYDYVIITSESLVPSFEALEALKESRGVSTNIVTTSYIYNNYSGVDQAEQVRNFIRDAYTDWGINYVLLGGDVDIVPYRGAYGSYGSYSNPYTACDMYFGCLDGSWNSDGDAYWGESNDGETGGYVDMVAEVFVGRAPVENGTQAMNFINKTITYETQIPLNPQHGLWIGQHLWDDVYGSHSTEPIRTQVMPQDWTSTTLYQEEGTFSAPNVIAGLNASPHVVDHVGHANQATVMGLRSSHVNALTNDSPFFVRSQGCKAGAFTSNDCMSEHFVISAHGAFASIMNSSYGWASLSGNPAYSHDFDNAFFQAIFRDGHTNLGLANQLSKEYNLGTAQRNSCYRWIYYNLNLMGDPQTALFTGFHVVNSNPAQEQFVTEPLTEFAVDFSFPYDPASVDVTDLSVNGLTSDRVTQVDADTLQFAFDTSPIAVQGVQTMHVEEGALLANASQYEIGEWNAEFSYGIPEITVLDSIGLNDDLSMDFGAVRVDGPGGESSTATFTIRNDGLSNLLIRSIALEEGIHYCLSGLPDSSFTLAPGASMTGTVIFDPPLAGAETDSLRIECNDQDEPTVDMTLSGLGVSPLVLNRENMRVRFYDLDNDYIDLMYKGDGEAWVATVNGLSPLDDPNQNIGYVGFTGSTSRSMLMARDMDPKAGANTLVLGTVETRGDGSTGIVRLIQKSGTIQNTTIDIGGSLRMLQVLGGATNLDVSIGGNTARIAMMGNVTNSTLDIDGAAGMIQVKKGLDQTTIDVGGELGKAIISGGMTDAILTVTGHTTMVIARDGQVDSTLSFNGGVDRLMLFGGLDNTDVSATGDMQKCMIKDGLANGSTLTVSGDVSQAMLFGRKNGDGVDAMSAATFGSLSRVLIVKGNLAGTVDIQASCVANGRNSLIKVLGDFDGSLLAGMFGDVTITGRFSGQIGDSGTSPGANNTLRVREPGGGGEVTPEDAFAYYINAL